MVVNFKGTAFSSLFGAISFPLFHFYFGLLLSLCKGTIFFGYSSVPLSFVDSVYVLYCNVSINQLHIKRQGNEKKKSIIWEGVQPSA